MHGPGPRGGPGKTQRRQEGRQGVPRRVPDSPSHPAHGLWSHIHTAASSTQLSSASCCKPRRNLGLPTNIAQTATRLGAPGTPAFVGSRSWGRAGCLRGWVGRAARATAAARRPGNSSEAPAPGPGTRAPENPAGSNVADEGGAWLYQSGTRQDKAPYAAWYAVRQLWPVAVGLRGGDWHPETILHEERGEGPVWQARGPGSGRVRPGGLMATGRAAWSAHHSAAAPGDWELTAKKRCSGAVASSTASTTSGGSSSSSSSPSSATRARYCWRALPAGRAAGRCQGFQTTGRAQPLWPPPQQAGQPSLSAGRPLHKAHTSSEQRTPAQGSGRAHAARRRKYGQACPLSDRVRAASYPFGARPHSSYSRERCPSCLSRRTSV
jgi:hypothetical protein